MTLDEVVDELALHEIYLEAFRIAVTQGAPHAVMTAYNKVNGEYANENAALTRQSLRGDWGFDGTIVTGWEGNYDRVAGLQAGNALEMPSTGGITDAEVVAAVREGRLDEEVVNQRVEEILNLLGRTAAADPALADLSTVNPDFELHHQLAVRAASESMVLLKNETGHSGLPLLPLTVGQSVAVIGDFASEMRIQGSGSSMVNPTRTVSPLDALKEIGVNVVGNSPGYRRRGGNDAALRRRAVHLAKRADRTLLFIGLDESSESEGVDREQMFVPRPQLALVRELLREGIDPVVILVGVRPGT